MGGVVIAVSRSPAYTFSKPNQRSIRLLTGLGIEGDAHCGERVQHRSRVARDPSQPSLRPVQLIQSEFHDALRAASFTVIAGQMPCRPRVRRRRDLGARRRGSQGRR
jgi:hypothetical protein